MVSGLPLASRRMVWSSGRSKCVISAGALQAICAEGTGDDGASGLNRSGGIERGSGAAIAGIAAGVSAGAATGVTSGTVENAAAGISPSSISPGTCACAALCSATMCTATNAAATAARLMQVFMIDFLAVIASFAFSWRRDEQQLRSATPKPSQCSREHDAPYHISLLRNRGRTCRRRSSIA